MSKVQIINSFTDQINQLRTLKLIECALTALRLNCKDSVLVSPATTL